MRIRRPINDTTNPQHRRFYQREEIAGSELQISLVDDGKHHQHLQSASSVLRAARLRDRKEAR